MGVGKTRLHDVGYGVKCDGGRCRADDVELEIQVGERGGEEYQPRNTGEEMQHRVAVAKSLHGTKPVPQQRVIEPEYLRHAARPADALADVPRKALGGESAGE